MTTTTETIALDALLILPRLRVQNANAISSPLTWGFPSITAFTGFMYALERKLTTGTLTAGAGLEFMGVGVICHGFEAQATTGGFTRSFHLTRNPILADGSTAGIVEEGRTHLDISLVFSVTVRSNPNEAQRQQLADHVNEVVAGMRLAGGSVMPPLPPLPGGGRRPPKPQLLLADSDFTKRQKDFSRLCRRLLPGFALVSRDDLLQTRLSDLKATDPAATALDAWLDLSRQNHRAERFEDTDAKTGDITERIEWSADRNNGWIVPIPVGYAALSPLYEPGTVSRARDSTTPFRFVESVYSIGQWVSPHRLRNADDLLWYVRQTPVGGDDGLYRCCNEFKPLAPPAPATTPAETSLPLSSLV